MCEKPGVFNSKIVPTYRTRAFTKKAYGTRTITKKRIVPAYRTSLQKMRRTYVSYCHLWLIVVTVVSDILYCSVCTTSLPAYTNAMATNTDSVTAPYFEDEVISYQCSDTYKPSPSDAALNCTCMIDAESNNTTASWSCNPDALNTSCVPSEFLYLKRYIFKAKT